MGQKQSKPRRGFPGLRCLKCGESDCITLQLADVEQFACSQCNEEYTAGEVRDAFAAWQTVLAWIEVAPTVGE